MRAQVVMTVFLVGAGAVQAQEQALQKELLRCATVPESLARLDCYDSLATAVVGPEKHPRNPDEWTVESGTDPLDDTTRVLLGLSGTERELHLYLRCQQGKPDVMLSVRGQVVGVSDPVVWTRFGSEKAERRRWNVVGKGKAVFLPGDAKRFIQRLASTDRLTVRMEHFLRGSITDVFDVHRLKEVMAPLNEACKLE